MSIPLNGSEFSLGQAVQVLNSPGFTLVVAFIVIASAAIPLVNWFSHRREERRREREVLAAEVQARALKDIAEQLYIRSNKRKQ